MKRSEFWNRLFNSGGNGIFVFVGTALIAVIAIVITACPRAADATPEEPKFTVSYHANGGEGTPDPATQEVNHNDIIAAAPTVSRPDYTLNAVWNTKADGTGETFKFGNGGTPITADITLYAQWTKQHTVSYNVNEGEGTPEPATETVSDGGTATKPAEPTRSGYVFTGWFDTATGGNEYTFGTAVTDDITLYAQWSNQQYTVSYHANGGDGTPNPATQGINHNDIIATAPTVSRPGYTLNAVWNTQANGQGTPFIFGTTQVTSDMDLYAQWTINQYSVSYNLNEGDGTAPAAETVNYNETATKPTDPTRTGHTFAGWFDAATGGNEFNFGSGGTPVTEDIELYAQWTIMTYTVSYNFNRGDSTAPATETVNYKGTATKPSDPTRSVHAFTGWFDAASGGSVYNFGTEVTADIELYAQWIKQYTVSYNVNGGESTAPANETVNDGEFATEPTDPTRTGHTFNGWYTAETGGDAFDFGRAVTAAIELYAQWTIITYTVSYDFNRGDSTEPSTETVEHGGTATRPTTDPARTGYTFDGWYTAETGGDAFDFGRAVTADITLYARWTPTLTVSGLSPVNGSSTTDTTPTFSWDAVPGAADYELRIADSQSGLDSAATVSVTGTSYTPSAALTNLQTYYWQVRAKDGAGQFGAWSNVHSLRVEWGAVSGQSPADGSTTKDTSPTFRWNAVPGAAGYEVRIADSLAELNSASSINVTGSSYTPASALMNLQTHYWQVRAKDGAEQFGTWSAVHSLEVALVPQGFVQVAGGTFQMGSTDSEADSDESPVHSVTVDSFYMAETEVTFDQYDAYCTAAGISKPSDSGWGRESRPAINVSWYDAVKYCNWLSEQEGLTLAYEINGTSVSWNQSANGYRLPTEAEWEYAARGGAQSNGYKYSGSNNVDEVGWYWDNSGYKTQPVKGKKANELGLYDMSGNVWEWCWDWYGSYSSSTENNPVGPSSGSNRVGRGGSWVDGPGYLRVADRNLGNPVDSYGDLGFRLVLRTN